MLFISRVFSWYTVSVATVYRHDADTLLSISGQYTIIKEAIFQIVFRYYNTLEIHICMERIRILYRCLLILFVIVFLQISCGTKMQNNNDVALSETLEDTSNVPEIDYLDSVVVARCIRPA